MKGLVGGSTGTNSISFFRLMSDSANIRFNDLSVVPFHLLIHRKVKTSFEKSSVCQFPSFESLSSYWKSQILVPSIPVHQPGSNVVIGMYYDPVDFVIKHMERWLERRELEGSPLPPGYYRVRFKV